jgi:hypothetical protein
MAGSWLSLPNDARLAGMGFAGAGAALGLDSLGVNPAGLSSQASPQVDMTYDQWVEDVSTQHLAAALPVAGGVAAFGLDYLNAGTVDTVAAAAAPGQYAEVTGSIQPWAMDNALTWAEVLGNLRAGVQVEYISEQWGIGGGEAAPAFGVGLQQDLRWGLGAGGSVTHIGALGGHSLPSEARLGLVWAAEPEWRLYLDGRAPMADLGGWNSVLGAEWQLRSNLTARAGMVGAGQDNSGGLCLGFSVRWQFLDLDYAYESGGALGSSQQLGLSMSFANGGAPALAASSRGPDGPGAVLAMPGAVAPAGPDAPQPSAGGPGSAAAPISAQGLSGTAAAGAAPLAGGIPAGLAAPLAAAPTPTVNLGDVLETRLKAALAAGDDTALLANLERLRIREPSRAKRWVHASGPALAQAALADGQSEQGYGLLRSALHAAGEDPVLLSALVQFCSNQGRRAEAALYAERALSVDPGLQATLEPWLKP